jgi:hypothetical protein
MAKDTKTLTEAVDIMAKVILKVVKDLEKMK